MRGGTSFALALVLSLATACWACWPAVSHPSDTILCGWIHPDCLSNHWLMVWVAEQLATGGSLLHNDRYYWPIGDSPWLAGNGSEGFAYLPWHLLLGWPLASTVHEVLMLTVGGMSAWTLARSAGASPAGSLAAAPTGASMVYAIQELGAGRFSQVSFCWLAFFLASWLRFCRRPTLLLAMLCGALLAATALFYWYYAWFGVIAGLVWLGVERPGARPLAAFAGAAVGFVAPLFWVFATHWSGVIGTAELAFPHPESYGDSCLPALPFLVQGGRHAGRALPLSTVALALGGLAWRRDRVTWGLVALAVAFALLMAGPMIPHGPYTWLYGLAAPLRRFWWPYRHVVVVNLALIALAARGADRWLATRPKLATFLAFSIPLQLEAQGAPWHALFSKAEVPVAFYREVGALDGDVIIEPPLTPDIAASQAPLPYQFDHHKALLNGHALWVARVRPAAWDSFVAGNSFLAAMQALERGQSGGHFAFQAADLRSLLDRGVGIATVNREYFPVALAGVTTGYEAVFGALFGAPAVKGKRALAWDMAHWNGATAAEYPAFTWPDGLLPGGPTLSLQAARPPSLAFSFPAPTHGDKRR